MISTTHFYHHCLSEELQEHVSGQLRKLLPEQLALNEEVAIHKARCADLVKEWSNARTLYNTLLKLPVNTPDRDRELEVARIRMMQAADRMSEAMKSHKDIALTAATVESKSRETLNEKTLLLLLNGVLDLVHEYFNNGTQESIEIMSRFEDDLRERVMIQEADANSLAIEGELYAMMQTIEGPK